MENDPSIVFMVQKGLNRITERRFPVSIKATLFTIQDVTPCLIDAGKIGQELGWKPGESFETGLRKTVQWYLHNRWWWEPLRERYNRERLGVAQ